MLISKFNKLIRNKVVWAVFAILVSLSMVGLFAPQPRESREERREGLGALFGESVSREAFSRARLYAQSFQASRGGEEIQRMVDEETWRRLAALRYAEKLGLRVAREDLVDVIHSDPSFRENGHFSMQRYQFLIEQQLGVPIAWFEEYLEQEILLERMRTFLDASLWIPAPELEENAARFSDTYEVAFVLIGQDVDLAVPPVEEADARRVFADTPHHFMVSAQRRVAYVAFSHTDNMDTDQISMRQIEARYESDPERFVYTDPETQITLSQPLEDVEDVIRLELAEQEAMAIASEKAMVLADELSLLERRSEVRLASVAEGMGMQVSTSAWFQASGPAPEGISAGAAFVQAAFRLSASDPSQSFSFGVPGTNAVYVMQVLDVAEEYLPAFEDVEDAAFTLARQFATEQAFLEKTVAMHARIAAQLEAGLSFADAAELEGLAVTVVKPFTLVSADPREIPFFGDLAPDLLPLHSGDLTGPIETTEGTVIAYLQQRTPGALEERLAIKPDLVSMMASGLEHVHFNAWIDSILEEARK